MSHEVTVFAQPACTEADSCYPSQACGGVELNVHIHGHAWCARCGAKRPMPVGLVDS